MAPATPGNEGRKKTYTKEGYLRRPAIPDLIRIIGLRKNRAGISSVDSVEILP